MFTICGAVEKLIAQGKNPSKGLEALRLSILRHNVNNNTVLRKTKVHVPRNATFIVVDMDPIEPLRSRIVARSKPVARIYDIGVQSFHFFLFGYYFFMCDVLDEKF